MENEDKVLGFRDAAFRVMDRANKNVELDQDGNFDKESLTYNLGYNAGVLDLVKEFEEQLDKIKGLQDVIRQIRGNEDSDDSDMDD